MQRVTNWIAWSVVLAIVLLAVLNWGTLKMPATIDLLVMRINAPLGVVMLALTGVLIAFFLVATLGNQIGSLLETRKLLKEVQRLQTVADQTEASRMQTLQKLMTSEFQLLNERFDKLSNDPRQLFNKETQR
jgi:uncharacterized integral membrane protein